MRDRTRRATAVGAAAVVLAGSAVLGMPGTASADTIPAKCGDTVTAKPGDVISTPFGLKTVTDGLTSLVGGLLGGLCKVTVNIVDTVVAPVPVVGAPAAGALNNTVAGTTNGITQATGDVGRSLSGGGKQSSPQPGGTGGSPQQPPAQGGSGGAPQGGTPAGTTPIPDANSPLLPGFASTPVFGGFPFTFGTGYAPMRDYSGIPFATAGLFTPSPAIRYGSQIPGYAPQYGLTGPDGTAENNSGVQAAGQAEALPSASDGFTNGSNLPLLIAVLALSGVSAGLVRTWVLRRMAAAN
ncbi:hypothetical protein SAMN04489727_1394 [Amycolatopsis tolypomycina]|uniref:Uncharacterized protein n=1 Tax=Amycolatopsis tolypomycina TaxID=208445 RepID=A0A1H4J1K3_9PSEU|nr:hypothetical protein [Amycolatopsis tolypomycina]SEB39965.1 hypothetical protein SAMN04489727_1394 [Amycolatopsis tolypomycina]